MVLKDSFTILTARSAWRADSWFCGPAFFTSNTYLLSHPATRLPTAISASVTSWIDTVLDLRPNSSSHLLRSVRVSSTSGPHQIALMLEENTSFQDQDFVSWRLLLYAHFHALANVGKVGMDLSDKPFVLFSTPVLMHTLAWLACFAWRFKRNVTSQPLRCHLIRRQNRNHVTKNGR